MSNFKRWIPALIVMVVIFLFSNTPGQKLPDYGLLDKLVKKGGHMTGYALLALSYWYALGFDPRKIGVAWLLAIGYALTDEFHQSFVPGRTPSYVDVFVFDGIGAALALLVTRFVKKLQSPLR
jgi:VanZ family protein